MDRAKCFFDTTAPRTIYEATSESPWVSLHTRGPAKKKAEAFFNLFLTGFMCLRGILVIWSTKIFHR